MKHYIPALTSLLLITLLATACVDSRTNPPSQSGTSTSAPQTASETTAASAPDTIPDTSVPVIESSPFSYTTADGKSETSFRFPHNTFQMTEHNMQYYRDISFDFRLSLPEGWVLEDASEDHTKGNVDGTDSMLSRIYIKNADGKTIGQFGFMPYNDNDADEAHRLMAIYSTIALGNGVHFMLPGDALESDENKYVEISRVTSGETAVTSVCYSESYLSAFVDNAAVKFNPGILTLNSEEKVFVAFEFDPVFADSTVVSDIARSIAWN